jgi:hypothetical protein
MHALLIFVAGCAAGAIGLVLVTFVLGYYSVFDDRSSCEDQRRH